MSDTDILEKLREGDDSIFKEIYSSYKDGFIPWIQGQSGLNKHDCTEIFQCAVVIMYDNVASGKLVSLTSTLKTYLFGIGRNLAMAEKRQQVKKSALPSFIQDHLTENGVYRNELFDRMYIALDSLGEPCKTVIEKHYFSGLSSSELAKALGYKNADTAKTKKYKCMQKLIKIINDQFGN